MIKKIKNIIVYITNRLYLFILTYIILFLTTNIYLQSLNNRIIKILEDTEQVSFHTLQYELKYIKCLLSESEKPNESNNKIDSIDVKEEYL